MAIIPSGSLAFTGYGDSASMRFYSPAGVDLGQPPSAPDCGSGVDGIVALTTTGRICIIGGNTPNFGTTGAGIFNTDFTVHGEGAVEGSSQAAFSVARDSSGWFYGTKTSQGAGGRLARIYRYTEAGVANHYDVKPDTWEMGAVGVNAGGTLAYFVARDSLVGGPYNTVYNYDLAGSANIGTFATGASGYTVAHNGILVLSNEDVLIAWKGSGNVGYVTRYSAAGATLATYTLTGTNPAPVVLTPALADTSFWVGYYDDDLVTYSTVRIAEIRVSDGVELNSFEPEDGTFQFDAPFAVLRAATGFYVPVAPPLAAQQPCAPQALVGNGGKGAAGCNVGGIGGGQQYVGALGDVPQHADPPAGELLTGKEGQGIEAWIELVHTDYPSGVKTTYRRAFEELADDPTYEGGRKPAGVLAIGDVENALGHEQGGFEAATADIALSDIRDRLIRELAEDQELEGDEVYVKLGSDPGRAAAVAPRVLFRGIVQKPELASGLHARLTVVDALFSDFGPFGPDRKDPNWTFGDLGSSAPQMTSDTKAQVIPRLYGEKSDEGAVDPLTGLPASKGLMPGFYLGRFDLTGLVAQAPPSSGQSLAAVVAQLQASHTAGTLVADWGTIIGAGDAAVLQAMGSVPTSYTSLAQVIGYGDLDVLLSMGTTAAPPPSDWGFIATGLGPWYAYSGVYGSDLGNGSATMQHDRVKLDPQNRADLLVPGVNFPFANPYFEFINDDGRVFWITGVFVMGPLLQDHLDGVVTMAFNAIGTEDVGDGSGLPIMRAEDCKQHWLENHCFDQWSSGPYTTTGTFPQWEDGTPKVNSTSFMTRQNFFKAQLGGEGLLFSWYTDTQQPTLETVRQLNASSESRLGVNKDGQMVDWGLDETVDYTLWPRVNHVVDVFDQVTRTSGEERQNVVIGSGDWDADFEKFRFGPLSVSSAMGLAKYKGRRKAGDAVDSMMLDREAMLLWVLERRLARLQIGTTLLQGSGPMGWLDRDVGDGILFTSEDGPGPNGYVDHPFVIVRRKTRLTTMLVQYTLWDVLPVITATLGSPGTP